MIELYTHLRNRLGLTLIDHDEFNHVDFLYSRNVSHMVYNGVIKTISKADFLDWVPVYDNTASFYALKTDSQCNNSESHGRISKRKKKGFWKKITSLMKMEVQPMISTEEEYNENTNKSRINL